MSDIWIGVAAFKSLFPGVARTIRAESAKVTVVSAPASVLSTTELAAVDFTVPTILAGGVCAKAEFAKNSSGEKTTKKPFATLFLHQLRGLQRIGSLLLIQTRA